MHGGEQSSGEACSGGAEAGERGTKENHIRSEHTARTNDTGGNIYSGSCEYQNHLERCRTI